MGVIAGDTRFHFGFEDLGRNCVVACTPASTQHLICRYPWASHFAFRTTSHFDVDPKGPRTKIIGF